MEAGMEGGAAPVHARKRKAHGGPDEGKDRKPARTKESAAAAQRSKSDRALSRKPQKPLGWNLFEEEKTKSLKVSNPHMSGSDRQAEIKKLWQDTQTQKHYNEEHPVQLERLADWRKKCEDRNLAEGGYASATASPPMSAGKKAQITPVSATTGPVHKKERRSGQTLVLQREMYVTVDAFLRDDPDQFYNWAAFEASRDAQAFLDSKSNGNLDRRAELSQALRERWWARLRKHRERKQAQRVFDPYDVEGWEGGASLIPVFDRLFGQPHRQVSAMQEARHAQIPILQRQVPQDMQFSPMEVDEQGGDDCSSDAASPLVLAITGSNHSAA